MYFQKMGEKIMIYSLIPFNQSWDTKVKAKRISEWDKAGCQRLSQAPSSKCSLPVSALRNPLDALGTGCNSTLHLSLMMMPSREVKKWFSTEKSLTATEIIFGCFTGNIFRETHLLRENTYFSGALKVFFAFSCTTMNIVHLWLCLIIFS